MRDFVLTSEAFTRGHPDKLCDQVSDAMVDACLSTEPRRGATAECALASGVIFLSLRTDAAPAFDPAATARRVIAEAGYGETPAPTVMLDITEDAGLAPPADAGASRARQMTTAFGHACRQTPALMAFPVWAARALARRIEVEQAAGGLPWDSPDAEVQVAVAFADRQPRTVTAVALTVPAGRDGPEPGEIESVFRTRVLDPVFADTPVAPDARTRLVIDRVAGAGGPHAHAGLTGRKTTADAYGGYCRQSGSALSGKDPARIDRVAVYAAHHAARAVVLAGLAGDCEVQLSYAPGDAGPLGVEVDSFDTGRIPDGAIAERLATRLDFSLGGICRRFALWEQPARHGGRFYADLAAHGHLGREDRALPWDDAAAAAAALAE